MGFDETAVAVDLFTGLVIGNVSHVANNGALLRFGLGHEWRSYKYNLELSINNPSRRWVMHCNNRTF
jgi:hypothetical protein